MRFIVWKCDFFDTMEEDSWEIISPCPFRTFEDAKQFAMQNIGDGLGGEWTDRETFVCFCKDADNMGIWKISPMTNIPTCKVENTDLWGF